LHSTFAQFGSIQMSFNFTVIFWSAFQESFPRFCHSSTSRWAHRNSFKLFPCLRSTVASNDTHFELIHFPTEMLFFGCYQLFYLIFIRRCDELKPTAHSSQSPVGPRATCVFVIEI
jgi:hypothetical protein